MAQASLFAMQHKLEWMAGLDMQVSDPVTNSALISTSTALLIQKEFEVIRQAHLNGAATEFQIQKMWEYIQHLALKHKQIGAGAKETSDKSQRIVQGLGEEM
eukprot:6414237-Karenia_brevis.AAC.1